DEVAIAFAAAAPVLLPCSAAANPDSTCFDKYVSTFARPAYRRALTADERAALQRTFDDATTAGASFADALAVVTSQLLQSPQFLYVVDDAAGTGRALAGLELASRLSFMLWDSIPDEELLDLAESGQLVTPSVLAAQAQRMFTSPKADPAMVRFVREWT